MNKEHPPPTTSNRIIRQALPAESAVLTDITFRSKGHWGYPPALMEEWRVILSVPPEWIQDNPTYVMEAKGRICGYYFLSHPEGDQIMLENLFVDPDFMGSGIGRALLEHALALAASLGYRTLIFESDPHAVDFYLKMGAIRFGEYPAPIPGEPDRVLPKMRIDLEGGV
jgi:GNAT superfamily N-acetyltransferase